MLKIIPKIPRRANRVFLHGNMPELRVGDVCGIREITPPVFDARDELRAGVESIVTTAPKG